MEVVLAILGSSAVASLVSGVFSIWNSRQKKENGVEEGVRILLYDRIKHLGISYTERGYVTSDEYEDLVKMHAVYHNSLNGNGFLDDIMNQVRNLQRK